MEDVAWIQPQSDGLQLITFLGDRRLIQAEIKSINLMDSSIVLKRRTAGSSPEGLG